MRPESEVFISYAREDLHLAMEIFQYLYRTGFDPWLDQEMILPGQDWEREISHAIARARIFLALLSTKSVDKYGYVQKELRKALELFERHPPGSIFLIPVRLDPCQPSHDAVAKLQWVDFFPDKYEAFSRLRKALCHAGLQPISRNRPWYYEVCFKTLDEVLAMNSDEFIEYYSLINTALRHTNSMGGAVAYQQLQVLNKAASIRKDLGNKLPPENWES